MGLEELIHPFPWGLYSKKLASKIVSPKFSGIFTEQEAKARDVRFVKGCDGTLSDGNEVHLYWLVDKEDGGILDCKFQAFGQSALIGAAELASELLIGKNYDQASRISTELIDKQGRDKPDIPAFPKETFPHLNLVLGAIENGANQCTDLPLPEAYVAPPMPKEIEGALEGGYPGWIDLPLKKKLAVIEEVLNRDIRPYIALDAGGVEVINLIHDKEVVISYQGACTSCYSSIGTTLSYIQQTIRAKVHPQLTVVPDIDFSSFNNQ